MSDEKHEGILLQVIPYLNTQRILKIFTPHTGLVTLMAKKVSHAMPFCRSEWVFRKSRGDMHSLRDVSLLDPLLNLHQSYEILSAAGAIASDLLHSQLPGKEAGSLYQLTLAYLQRLGANAPTLRNSFRLKLLQIEGLLHLQSGCHCGRAASCLHRGESLCSDHAPPASLFFTANEWETVCRLALSRSFLELQKEQLTIALIEKIDRLFLGCF